ncbi:hypothetical protein TrCOL_g10856 [Triparma columacea]|uniref:Uncharacterized protein n=1 Tax=Triparma columacea TaxID=722753 RepID=A0A9W7L7I6_9STRA|nr:hypothetical protein TrCOL_g10856 [Triparma columacea]
MTGLRLPPISTYSSRAWGEWSGVGGEGVKDAVLIGGEGKGKCTFVYRDGEKEVYKKDLCQGGRDSKGKGRGGGEDGWIGTTDIKVWNGEVFGALSNGIVFNFDPKTRSMKWINRRGPRWVPSDDPFSTLSIWSTSSSSVPVVIVAGGKDIVAVEGGRGKVAGSVKLKQNMAAKMLGDEGGVVVFTDDVVWGYDVDMEVSGGGAWRMVVGVGVVVMVALVTLKSNGVLEEEYGIEGEEEYERADDLDKEERTILEREIRMRR